jgi:hypothetical protein
MEATATSTISADTTDTTDTTSATPWKRAAPILGGAALAAAGVYTALNDPAAPGTHFLFCPFHSLTGLWCPGCGLTRGVHQLLTGHPSAALGYNVFVPLALLGIVVAWWNWMCTAWGRPAVVNPSWVKYGISNVLPALLVVYGVARNLPIAPFRSLAP